MSAAPAIATIGAAFCRELIAKEMFNSRATVPAAAKDAYLVNKIAGICHGAKIRGSGFGGYEAKNEVLSRWACVIDN